MAAAADRSGNDQESSAAASFETGRFRPPSSFSTGQNPVKALWIKFTPTIALSHSHAGLTYRPRKKESTTKNE